MLWYVPVLLRIVVTYVALPILVKPLAEHPARAPILALQFFGAVGLALPAAVVLGQATLHGLIAVVGFFTGLAAYAYWRAIDLSLSRTALFAFWDDLIAMGRFFCAFEPKELTRPEAVRRSTKSRQVRNLELQSPSISR